MTEGSVPHRSFPEAFTADGGGTRAVITLATEAKARVRSE
jgi:hypothetical protein